MLGAAFLGGTVDGVEEGAHCDRCTGKGRWTTAPSLAGNVAMKAVAWWLFAARMDASLIKIGQTREREGEKMMAGGRSGMRFRIWGSGSFGKAEMAEVQRQRIRS